MTRRSLLVASAGGLLSSRMDAGVAFAAVAAPPGVRLKERWVGRVDQAGLTIELGGVADLIGVQWQGSDRANMELRFRVGRRWSEWVAAGSRGHGPEGRPAAGERVGEPLWTGGTSVVQLRSGQALDRVRLHLIDVSAGVGARRQALMLGPLASAARLARASPVLMAGAGQPPIIARRAWARGMAPPRVAPQYGAMRLAFVHHTESPNGYLPGEVPAMLRAIYAFHRYVNGWNDIGYNFVLDLYGRIFEARAGGIDEPVVGAHAGGYNLVSTGVAVLGSFMSVPISAPAHRALERLLAWKLSLHGLPARGKVTVTVNPAGAVYSRFPADARVSLPRIAGHRDADSTDCPGDVLYGELRRIRAGVGVLAAHPVKATIALGTAEAPPNPAPVAPGAPAASSTPEAAGGPPPPAPAMAPIPVLDGTLTFLDGTPIGGARVLIQARSVARRGEVVRESTIAEAPTDSQGRWSLAANVLTAAMNGAGALWLRALFIGASGVGAAVSDPLRVSAGEITPLPAAPPTPPEPPPPAP